MHIQIDSRNTNSITSYSETQLCVGDAVYQQNVVVSNHQVLSTWLVQSIHDLNEVTLTPLIQLKPEIILIGHQQINHYPPVHVLQWLSQQRIGIECMSIGSACRTFNLLLSEGRHVVGGFIFSR
jgi:uncharacterized protein